MTRVNAFADDALGASDATDLAARIARGEISAAEAVDAAIARVQAVDPDLGAVVFDDYERARRRAASLPHPHGAFAGVPSATKDNIHVEGMPLTFSSKAMPRQPKAQNSPWTEQFLSTGVVPLCSTKSPEFGWTGTTECVGGDVTHNPWHTDYSPGGSSGGSAALVAAGALPVAHGNDGGGSIRIPAAACGLVGLKVTRGRHRRDPISSGMPIDLVTNGVLVRSVRDAANFHHALENAWAAPRMKPIGHVTRGSDRPLRIGLLTDSPLAPRTDDDTRAAVLRVAGLLADRGHRVSEFTPRVPRFFATDFEDYWSMLAFGITTNGRHYFGKDFDPAALDPFTRGLARRFARRSYRTPLVLARMAAAKAGYARLFGPYDVVLSPTLVHTTPKLGHLSADQPFEQHFNRLLDYVGFTPLHNVTGAPSISVPGGISAQGLPVGVMFSGHWGDESTLLQIAFDVEEARPFPRIDQR